MKTGLARLTISTSKIRFWRPISVVLLLTLLISGVFIAGKLADFARTEIVREGETSLSALCEHFSSEVEKMKSVALSMSGSPGICPALSSKKPEDLRRALDVMRRYYGSFRTSVCYLLDEDGTAVEATNRERPDSFVGKNYAFRPYFREAMQGWRSHCFGLGVTSHKRGFYFGAPVYLPSGRRIGVAAVETDVETLESSLEKFPLCFLVSPEGVVMLASRKEFVLKGLWPIDTDTKRRLLADKRFGEGPFGAILDREVRNDDEIVYAGKPYLVGSKRIPQTDWSIILLSPTDPIAVYRTAGIAGTLFVCTLLLIPILILHLAEKSSERLRESNRRFEQAAEASVEWIWEVDRECRYVYCSRAVEKILGYEPQEMIGKRFTEYHADAEGNADADRIENLLQKGLSFSQLPQAMVHKEGRIVFLEATCIPVRNDRGEIVRYLGTHHDISIRRSFEKALRESENRYRELSITDDLTKLQNMRQFSVSLKMETERARRYGRPLSMILLDIDDFKHYNDACGHLEGDQVLKGIASAIQKNIRKTDMAFRFGGEEFIVLLPETDNRNARNIAERIREEFAAREWLPIPGIPVHKTASFGLAQYKAGEDMKEFITRSDRIMYLAKRNGKNRVCDEADSTA